MAQRPDDIAHSARPHEAYSGAGSVEVPEETEIIKARIEQTREQMGETIEALQERLTLSNISDQVSEQVSVAIEAAKDTLYDATIGKAVQFMKNKGNQLSGSSIVRTVKADPLPLVLIGLGSGLLVYNQFRSGNAKRGRNGWTDTGRDPATKGEMAGRSSFGREAEATTGKLSAAASSAVNEVSSKFESAISGTKDIANRAYSKAGEFGTLAHEKYDRYMFENPLAVGAAAFALGAAIGFAIPSTEYESELMGKKRDELLRKAKDAGSQILDRTKELIDEAAQGSTRDDQMTVH